MLRDAQLRDDAKVFRPYYIKRTNTNKKEA